MKMERYKYASEECRKILGGTTERYQKIASLHPLRLIKQTTVLRFESDSSQNKNSGQKIRALWPEWYFCLTSDSRFLECADEDRNQVDEKSIDDRKERA